ncbi:cohesin loading factor-domain-containing protein [Elsinoe ampelina]|uniref:Cohesin loading factor-domain-containing protein n=1 Tax=Elsinoe ampelina TaxID=302913 RepID=A0A6A6G6A5_9PEZI|nr:cohesin loading factor-domain-containing protein [Elsinoe ampelina]
MSNQNYGQNWQQQQGQYGYNYQDQYQQPRQPMVVIPQRPQEELMQYYNQQNNYSPAPNYQTPGQQPFPPQQQVPAASFDYGFQHPQLQHMQSAPQSQSQMQYNQHMFQSNQQHSQQFQRQQTHQDASPMYASTPPTLTSQSQGNFVQSQSSTYGGKPNDRRVSSFNGQMKRHSMPLSQPVVSASTPKATVRLPSTQQAQTDPRPTKVPQVVIPVKHKSAAATSADASGPRKPQPAAKPQGTAKLQGTSKSLSKASSTLFDGVSDEEADRKLILLSLADQCISTARSMSNSLARSSSDSGYEEYQNLMTTGLQCLHAAIQQWKVGDARTLVRLRLQYATLLFEETDSDDIAQSQLSQGTTACDRSKLFDQKFSMQHLLARIQFKTKPKAAFKVIDGALEDVVAYKNVIWIYVFRLLRTSLTLQLCRNTETQSTVQNLRQLIHVAEARKDVPVLVMGHVLEACVYLRSGSAESTEHAQRAIAAARSFQLHPSLQKLPQLRCMIIFQDLCCDLATGSLEQLESKIDGLQELVDAVSANSKMWPTGNFNLPTSVNTSSTILEDTSGILRSTADGKASISLRWMNQTELFTLAFLLCGVTKLQKNCMDSRAEQYISEGISYAKRDISSSKGSKSLESAIESVAREEYINLTLHIYRVIAHAIRSNWPLCTAQLKQIRDKFSPAALEQHGQILQYLDGVIKQGSGDLRGALASYGSADLSVPAQPTIKISGSDLETRLVATMNRIMILKSSAGTNAEGQALLQEISPLCSKHHNEAIQAAAKMLQATPNPTMPVIQLKEFLHHSLQIAQKLKNQQLKTLLLNVMNVRFFAGIVGEQANKSATTSWQLARQMRSPLWMGVSGQNLAQMHRLHGCHEEARQAQHDAERAFASAPEGVKRRFEQ